MTPTPGLWLRDRVPIPWQGGRSMVASSRIKMANTQSLLLALGLLALQSNCATSLDPRVGGKNQDSCCTQAQAKFASVRARSRVHMNQYKALAAYPSDDSGSESVEGNSIAPTTFLAAVNKEIEKGEHDLQKAQDDAQELRGGGAGNSKDPVPSYKTLILFMIPTLGIYLASPILSLADTAFVGQYCGSTALAALGPATALADMVVFLSSFMSVATTNLLASALARGDRSGGRRIVASIMSMSAMLGITIGILLCITAPYVVPFVIGAASTDTVPYALQYVSVRAIGVPFGMMLSIAQAASIGAKESIAPLFAVIMQSLLNVLLDWIMVVPLGIGVAGAAWATIMSQIIASMYLCHRVSNLLSALGAEDKLNQPPMSLSVHTKQTSILSVRSWLQMFKVLSVVPTRQEFQEVRSFCGPLFFMRCVQGFYWWSCAFAAAAAGTVSLAAHQVLIGLFWLFAVASEALCVMGQTFLPALSERQTQAQKFAKLEPSEESKQEVVRASDRVVKLLMRIAFIGLSFGVSQALLGAVLAKYFPHVFTKDRAVVAAVTENAHLLGLCILPHSFSFAFEGLLVSVRDLKFLSTTYVAMAVVWAGFLQYMRVSSPTLPTLWWGLVGFNVTRASQWILRSILAGHHVGLPLFPYIMRKAKKFLSTASAAMLKRTPAS